jgi:very-short-patch-repair endonuclease
VRRLFGDMGDGLRMAVFDRRREALLRNLGYRVLRIPDSVIYENLDGFVESHFATLPTRAPPLADKGVFPEAPAV